MEFRKAAESDVKRIMAIINQAQAYFKAHGIDQWQDNYPDPKTIQGDIFSQNGYVLLRDDIIVGTVAVSFDGEKSYDSIYCGKWISNDKYAVIHRIAVDDNYKGLGLSSVIIKNIEEIGLGRGLHSIKVDTHKMNASMQRLLLKNGFRYCGVIYLKDGSERIAFEKIL
jgi:GNAT superfamily N-acetyltransferase